MIKTMYWYFVDRLFGHYATILEIDHSRLSLKTNYRNWLKSLKQTSEQISTWFAH